MIEQAFSLSPLPTPTLPDLFITGGISLQKNILSLHYSVMGEIEHILLPPTSIHPSRQDELWRSTCFEFFLAIKDQPQYWEFNMSPSGDWNIYHMDAYRRVGFREERLIQQLPFTIRKEVTGISLHVLVDLDPILLPGQVLELGITAVILTTEGSETYWAVVHPKPAPDFHLRESFILRLAEPVPLARQSAPDR